MSITPDTKDWTWVLENECPECHFEVRLFPRERIGSMIRDNAAAWGPVLAHPKARIRPAEDTWSALEYGCHVRDVFRLFDERLGMMLEEDEAHYVNWDQDETAVEQRYGDQDPEQVVKELTEASHHLAGRFDGVEGAQWERSGFRSDGARFTTESFARYLIHDPYHHLYDVEQGFVRLNARG